jgi:predicted phage baseplate assembly protein
VVETESDGSASLRFGDDVNGQRPDSGTQFQADYRVGNGTAGNVGALTILQIVGNGVFDHYIIGVRNPLPATGGVEPESIEHVRQSAPYAFRTQERAVTAADYAAKAEQYPGVLRAAATFRWTGSWYTVFLTIDRQGGQLVDDAFREGLLDFMNQYRMAGYDLEIDAPRYVSLEIEMEVCVAPDHFCSDVAQALLLRLSNRMLPCGQPGLFYPDNFTFGQSVYLSQIYAAAQGVDGVAWARVTTFQEQGKLETSALGSGVLKLNRLEIARLDNDPNYSEHGVLRLKMMGGK